MQDLRNHWVLTDHLSPFFIQIKIFLTHLRNNLRNTSFVIIVDIKKHHKSVLVQIFLMKKRVYVFLLPALSLEKGECEFFPNNDFLFLILVLVLKMKNVISFLF